MCEHVNFPKDEMPLGHSHNVVGDFHVIRQYDGSYYLSEMVDDGINGEFQVHLGSASGVFPRERFTKLTLQHCLERAQYYNKCALALAMGV